MHTVTVVVYDEHDRVVLDVDGKKVDLSADEPREIASALNDAAARCTAKDTPTEPARRVYKLGA